MKSLISTSAFVFTIIFGLCSAPVFAKPWQTIVVFGDSLSDIGNHPYHRGGSLVPDTNPYQGSTVQWGGTSGVLWIQLLVAGAYQHQQLVTPILIPSQQPSQTIANVDYAWASAVSGDVYTNDVGTLLTHCHNPSAEPLCIPGVLKQVHLYLQAHQGQADPKTLYIIWGGANDIINNMRNLLTFHWFSLVSHPERAIVDAATLLATHGAHDIVIIDMPNIAWVPGLHGHPYLQKLATHWVNDFNQRLQAGLVAAPALKTVHWQLISVNQPFNAMVHREGAYHAIFADTTDECEQNVMAIKNNCRGYLFWDDKHPAYPTEQVIAQLFMQEFIIKNSADKTNY